MEYLLEAGIHLTEMILAYALKPVWIRGDSWGEN